MSNPEAKTKKFRKSLKLVVDTSGEVTLYGLNITDLLTEHNYPMWFRMYADTLAEYARDEEEEDVENKDEGTIASDDNETNFYKVFGVKPSDFF
ncbi:hypothetical protein [Microscilla marina]|uniref:Uncharacterized protein n=1 Tax=Microscilla marina ATCC 23134 TaxID=313606 RepID=A1ZJZ5_MICM2|nr:hypothetical protein [Microscilla marina]EAY29448.1 hypothetical protein M23134_01508 [Microscilla marina ATCC 23134]